ncbi:MAG: tRNA (adenine-N1)-methyltransferase [Anaerolineaceae bacterium]|jgi:tRNA (adenine57-N1/adenine58-N1)-methyltransferase|nr:tRNA (adenine-N1)-methyltransferase [Anaerolineaceae bacterium]MDD4043004.1 tRNA (adenine-N1)-methyltransferase [Anaerolineaceae bacterium]MDD4578267.1 tRNA (adenine-N1)-methyltransferase [Anaerolineaceae bacterium]
MTDQYSDPVNLVKEGDLVQLHGTTHKNHLLIMKAGEVFMTHRGVIRHDDIIGQPWGVRLESHSGHPFFVLQPGITDLVQAIKRTTQIMYPKDIGYIVLKLGVGPGKRVLECGGGSGGLTTVLAYLVGDTGKVYSYERNPEVQNLARKNLRLFGLDQHVEFKPGDAAQGFDERYLDAIFLDLPNPYDYLEQVGASLKGGGQFATLLPTINQVELTLRALSHSNFAFIDVCEILLRHYKPDWGRLRPVDRMVAHTGYLIFARSIQAELEDLGDEAGENETDD